MKKIVSVILTLAVLLLGACGGNESGGKTGADTVPGSAADAALSSEAASGEAAPATEPAAEPVTEPPRVIDRTAKEVYERHEELTPVNYDSPALLPICADRGQASVDSLVFLCDSPIYWLKLYGLLSDGYDTAQVWTGPEGTMTLGYLEGFQIVDPTDGALRTIPETAALRKPERILITLGINGVGLWGEEKFVASYKTLIDELQAASPDTEILLQSILPISPKYRYWGGITNATITAANSWILRIAQEYSLGYLDTFSVLVGEDGNIKSELVQEDGLHPNRDGLTKVLEYIRTHG